jgi:hypothetical protein
MNNLSMTIRKPEKVLEIDESVTKVIVKRRVQGVKIEDESSSRTYLIKRTPVKNGLKMIGT